jgi:hypothetical protein
MLLFLTLFTVTQTGDAVLRDEILLYYELAIVIAPIPSEMARGLKGLSSSISGSYKSYS